MLKIFVIFKITIFFLNFSFQKLKNISKCIKNSQTKLFSMSMKITNNCMIPIIFYHLNVELIKYIITNIQLMFKRMR